jgi:hypothetical protein
MNWHCEKYDHNRINGNSKVTGKYPNIKIKENTFGVFH